MLAINNPANIRFSKRNNWLGQLPKPYKGFCQFKSEFYGLRAFAKLLHTYFSKYYCFTVHELIAKYAPPSENNTSAYIGYVTLRAGDDVIHIQDPDYMYRLFKAMLFMESSYKLLRSDFEMFNLYNFCVYGRKKI